MLALYDPVLICILCRKSNQLQIRMIKQGFTPKNTWVLTLLTTAFIVGEISHFLFGTISREMAQDIHFGDKKCYEVSSSTKVTKYSGNGCSNNNTAAAAMTAVATTISSRKNGCNNNNSKQEQ